MQKVTMGLLVWLTIAAAVLAGCAVEAPHRWGAGTTTDALSQQGDRSGPIAGPPGRQASPDCLPAMGGELVINELLARPAGLDLDGDGLSNHRDEAIEVRLSSTGTRHLQGAQLRVAGQVRGVLLDSTCHWPGALLVVVGSTTGLLLLPAAIPQLHLSGPLGLPDKGADLALIGRGGGTLDQVAYPVAPEGRSLVRTPEGSRWAPLLAHPDGVDGSGHSLGKCSDGSASHTCWTALAPPWG